MFYVFQNLKKTCHHPSPYPLLIFRANVRAINGTYYEILGISPRSTPKEIKAAFISLSKQNHPDSRGSHEKFVLINEAYQTLSDPSKRRLYDLTIGTTRPGTETKQQGGFTRQNYETYAHKKYYYKEPFGWNEGGTAKEKKPPGIFNRRYSNFQLVSALIMFMLFGAVLQGYVIGSGYLLSSEKLRQRSKENALLHAEIRERAKALGNAQQLAALKEQLSQQSPARLNEKGKKNTSEVKMKFVKTDRICPRHRTKVGRPEEEKRKYYKETSQKPILCQKCKKSVPK